MIELLSIHIPKTGGTSFYHILQQVYGGEVSKSYKRKDYLADIKKRGVLKKALAPQLKVLHGHFYYSELESIHRKDQSKVICWLRDPVERVVSNYNFFIKGLNEPNRNPTNFKLNEHRIDESLLDYAQRDENQNRMSGFLDGIALEDLFFFGLLENFETDLNRLAKLLNWKAIDVPKLNESNQSESKPISKALYKTIENLNKKDVRLYQEAIKLLNGN